MSDATKYPPSTHGVRARFSQWVRKSCGLNYECRGLENISLPSVPCQSCGGGVAIYRPFGKFRTVACMLLKANVRRISSSLPR
ncbi:hypothetical protein TNCV_2427461 [Trichonephila clavipes]|nr:hypothetical protein TNCV_2427461 [Trichonephila clavipes]